MKWNWWTVQAANVFQQPPDKINVKPYLQLLHDPRQVTLPCCQVKHIKPTSQSKDIWLLSGEPVMRLTSVLNASAGIVKSDGWPVTTQCLWVMWPGCCMIIGDSWPLCGLLGVSPGSAGCSWSSDLCCRTPRALSDRRTPPGRQTERVRWGGMREEGKRGERKIRKWEESRQKQWWEMETNRLSSI